MGRMSAARPADSLARPLALAYALLVAYACLHPLAGWRDSGLPPFDWLWAPWPKYFILEDFIFNIFGYLPLGYAIPPGVRVSVDSGKEYPLVPQRCIPQGCEVATKVEPELLAALKKGNSAKIEFQLGDRNATVAVSALCALVSLLRGQDANWDLRNYHLHNAWSLLEGRLGVDLRLRLSLLA